MENIYLLYEIWKYLAIDVGMFNVFFSFIAIMDEYLIAISGSMANRTAS